MTDTPAAPPPAPAPDDEQLLSELHRAAALGDPVPDGWRATAREAFAWSAVGGEVARLVHDARSVRDGRVERRLIGSTQRTLRFRSGRGAGGPMVEIELDVGADKVRVTGRLRPPGPAMVVAMSRSGRVPAPAGPDGVFHVDELPRRPFCLLVTGEAVLKTEWVVP